MVQTLMEKKEHPGVSEKESVSQHIHLMVISKFGEIKFQRRFGNAIWENEFAGYSGYDNIREKIKKSLYDNLVEHEPRLKNIEVLVSLKHENSELKAIHRLRERVELKVLGTLIRTEEPFLHHEFFYIAPLSYS